MKHTASLFLLIGPPASGKSTWVAKFLESASRPTTVVSSDDILETWGNANGLSYADAFTQCDHKWLKGEVNRIFDEAVKRGDDVIVDRTNMTKKIRRSFLSRVPKTTKTIGVLFEVDRDVLNERLDTRAQQTGKYIPQAAVDQIISIYAAPSLDEFDEITKAEQYA